MIKAGRFFSRWTLAITLLILIIVAGGIVIIIKSGGGPGIEISLSPPEEITGNIFISGGVNNPGLYPLHYGDNLEDLIRAAGGLKEGADLNAIELTIDIPGDKEVSQKININRAEAWLLEALPGVGESRALAIIQYRRENGPFRDINELMNVPGFGDINFNKVKEFITVYD